MTDEQLLAEFVERQSQDAFAQLMARYAPLVYAAARRQAGGAEAEDVSQAVFITLSKKASHLRGRGTLAGWLLKATHYAARAALRRERRLKRREQLAAAMSEPRKTDQDQPIWNDLRPVIDQAMLRLRPKDRDAVALRYLQSKSLREVGDAIGATEEAARKRVDRAMDRLRASLSRGGLSIKSASLGAVLAMHGLEKPPAALLSLKASASSIAISKAGIVLMGAKSKIALGVAMFALLVGSGAAIWYVQRANQTVIVRHSLGSSPTVATATVPTRIAMKWQANRQGRYVTSGALDKHGRLWIGSEDDGLWLCTGAQWKHFTATEGLGENSVYAVACDSLGRIWAGHDRHGVSVYNGKMWANFDAFNGPLGSHVSAIKVCPATASRAAGDIWMITELGLARYSISSNSWSYFTRAEGLPSDQASSIDFDSQGNLYLGTGCDGLAIAQAADDYKTWRTLRGAEEQPTTATGSGLPSNNINAVLVARSGAIFVATSHGLARSTDQGNQWTFFRGKDWVAKLRGSIDGPPPGWAPPADPAPLAEDHITALAEDESGSLWIGYQTKGYQCVNETTLQVLASNQLKNADWCAMILPIPGGVPLLGTRGFGLAQATGPANVLSISAQESSFSLPPLPTAASVPTAAELAQLTQKVKAASDGNQVAVFLGEDWVTQGDWVGHYGRQKSYWPRQATINPGNEDYQLIGDTPLTGPHHLDDSGRAWTFFMYLDAKSPRVLYAPWTGHRIQGEWNDGAWQEAKFGPNFEGPDLWLGVQVPAGIHRVSLFIHDVGHNSGTDRRRDYTIQLKPYTEDLEAAQHEPALADVRVMPSQNPAYRTFLVSQGRYWIRIASNYSQMASLQAIFFDRADFTKPQENDSVASTLYGIAYNPPQPMPESSGDSNQLRAARSLWSALDSKYASTADMQLPYRVLAYRAAATGGGDKNLLTNWRWNLHLWTNEDWAEWEKVMAEARKLLPKTNPAGAQASQ